MNGASNAGQDPWPRGHGAGGGTQSLCPVCLKRINAQLVKWGKHVYMVKQCPEHGEFRTLIWRGDAVDFADWSRPKIPSQPLHCHTQVENQCPFDCGLCPETQAAYLYGAVGNNAALRSALPGLLCGCRKRGQGPGHGPY